MNLYRHNSNAHEDGQGTTVLSTWHGSNREFSMMKRKFGDSVRSKNDVAMTNEVLCRILCHHLVVLIHEMHELGIDPVF